MHWIQIYILEQLLFASSLRNRDMRPAKVESNLYQYHLKQLIKQQWVKKLGSEYVLDSKGLAWADRYSGELKAERRQSKVISVLIIENNKHEFLLIPRKRQPFLGSFIIPSGKIKMGEPTKIAAKRELKEKTGLENIPLSMAGTARIITTTKSDVITDVVAFLWHGQLGSGQNNNIKPTTRWVNANELSKTNEFPGTAELLQSFAHGKQHTEISITL